MLNKMKRDFVLTNLMLVSMVVAVLFGFIVTVSYDDKMEEVRRALFRPVDAYAVANETGYLTAMYIMADENGQIIEMHNKREALDENIVDDAVLEFILEKEPDVHYNDKYDAYFTVNIFKDKGYIISAINGSYVSNYMYKIVIRYILLYIGIIGIFYVIIRKNAMKVVMPIETAWNEQKRFIADVSHELKTPLAIISANNQILKERREALIEDEIQWVNGTLKEVEHMKDLLEDMIYLARHDSFDLSIEKKKIDLSDMVAEDILQFEPVAYELGIDFNYEIEPGIDFECDETEIKQLGRILLDNATKYCEGESRKIEASLKKKKEIVISVKNTSNIIQEENLVRIFDRFYREDEARTKKSGKKGYGLGLSIAKTIVKKHNGIIKAYSGPNCGPDGLQGTEIEVRFKV